MIKAWVKNATFPCVVGTAYILAQVVLMSFIDTLTGLLISSVLCGGATIFLLLMNRSYDGCCVFTTTTCGVTSVVVLLDFLMDIRVGIENKTFFLLALNWAIPTIICAIVRLCDRKKRISGFDHFFKVVSIVFFVIYLLSLVALLFFGSVNRGHEYQGVNLIPFKTIWMYLTSPVLSDQIKILNLAGNILIFAPLGFYLTVFSHRIRLWLRLLILLFVPVLVEILQYVFHTGASDVDDVILNFLGGVIGVFVCFVIEQVYKRFHKDRERRLFAFKHKN